jgi:hypothetical protein
MTTRFGLIEEPSYAASITALGGSIKRMDELLSSATWLIARSGDDDSCTTEVVEGIRVVKTEMPESHDLLRLWYALDLDSMMAHLLRVDFEVRPTEEDTPW